MSFFVKDLCLFSEVKGVVLHHGKPVAKAEVERIYTWQDRTKRDKVCTDAQGLFYFPVTFGRSLIVSLLPFESHVSQTVLIRHDGRESEAWIFSKNNFRENGELNGKPMNLVCDLAAEPKACKKFKYYGICKIAE